MVLDRWINILEGIVIRDISKEKCIWGLYIVNK